MNILTIHALILLRNLNPHKNVIKMRNILDSMKENMQFQFKVLKWQQHLKVPWGLWAGKSSSKTKAEKNNRKRLQQYDCLYFNMDRYWGKLFPVSLTFHVYSIETFSKLFWSWPIERNSLCFNPVSLKHTVKLNRKFHGLVISLYVMHSDIFYSISFLKHCWLQCH